MPVGPSTGAAATRPGTSTADSREYGVKYLDPLQIPRHGFCGQGTLTINSARIRLSGTTLRGYCIFLLVLFAVSFFKHYAGLLLGVRLNPVPNIVIYLIICLAVLLILHYKWKVFAGSSTYRKERIGNVVRDRRKVSFDVSGPSGTDERPIRVPVRARNEEEAAKIENELRT
jgi:hypothetical protein